MKLEIIAGVMALTFQLWAFEKRKNGEYKSASWSMIFSLIGWVVMVIAYVFLP